MRALRLSVLDVAPVLGGSTPAEAVKEVLNLARRADELGFSRFWLAEHHNMGGIASSSPEVLIGHVAQVTRRIRVGSGGIMLPNHAALRIAESFRTLEALHPGRIDLGLGRAPGTNSRTALALRGSGDRMSADDFPEQVSDLLAFLQDAIPDHHPFRGIVAVPSGVPMPEPWILGSSDFGARMAGELGLGYAFAQHFSTFPAAEVMRIYRKHFRPSKFLAEPSAIVAVHAICAETDEQANELALSSDVSFYSFRQTGKSLPLPSVEEARATLRDPSDQLRIRAMGMPKFVGSPAALRDQLSGLLADTGAQELMILTMIHDPKARYRSYELLREAMGQQHSHS